MFGEYTVPILIGVGLLLATLGVLTLWRKVPQDKALVVTGLKRRTISGGGGIVIPLLERSDIISLENMTIDIEIKGALTEQGVGINVDGVAVIKVKSSEESILSAMEQFNAGNENKTIINISDTSKNVLEGKLREIVAKMTVEDTYKDRDKFGAQVQEVAALDLATMGLEIKAFTIKTITDNNGYLEALGRPKIAAVRKDAEIAEAEASKETKIRTAQALREGEAANILSQTQIAEAEKDKELKIQDYRKDKEKAKAIADLAYQIEANKVNKEVTETEMLVEITKKEKETEVQEQERKRKEKELAATIKAQADAEKYKQEKEAEAYRYQQEQEAQAKAKAIELEGNAKAKAIEAEGRAEAEAMRLKAEAFKLYNEAAVTQMIIERLPEIAKAVAEPLSKTEKIVIVDNSSGDGKGAAKITNYVTDIMSQLPETVEALTGFNLNDILKNVSKAPVKDFVSENIIIDDIENNIKDDKVELIEE